MRLQRHKMGVEDFELLTMIGKGAFGEVYFFILPTSIIMFYLPLCNEYCCHRLPFFFSLSNKINLLITWKYFFMVQVRVCREKTTGHVYAMKKLKKSEMLRRGQVHN